MKVLCHMCCRYIVRERMEEMTDLVKENLMETQKRQKQWYNRTARERA